MGIGGQELIVIFFVALIVLGPKRLPEVARTLSRLVREARRVLDEITREFTDDDRFGG